jgi:hypothetical protein
MYIYIKKYIHVYMYHVLRVGPSWITHTCSVRQCQTGLAMLLYMYIYRERDIDEHIYMYIYVFALCVVVTSMMGCFNAPSVNY